MELVLLQNVAKLGRRGAVEKVAPGYARNYLVPRQLAVPVTAKNRAALTAQLERVSRKEENHRARAEETAQRLTNVALTFAKLANDGGELYGSLTAAEVADALAELGFAVDKKQIAFDTPAARVGVFTARVQLYEGVEAAIPVTVVRPES